MSKLSTLFCLAALAVFASAAFADDDPSLFQNGANCAGTYWCASAGLGFDPVTSTSTLEFVLNSSVNESMGFTPFTVTGLVAYKTGSVVEDELDFEIIGGKDVIFLYCGNA